MALSARKGQIVLVQRQQSSVTVSVGCVVWREYDQSRQGPLVTRLLEAHRVTIYGYAHNPLLSERNNQAVQLGRSCELPVSKHYEYSSTLIPH